MFTSQIKYNESKYNIDYLVYFGSAASPVPATAPDVSDGNNKLVE